jgi:hypothetical protein
MVSRPLPTDSAHPWLEPILRALPPSAVASMNSMQPM